MHNLRGKKLLVLGSNSLTSDIVRAAQSLGVYVIVTDWNRLENAPAKQIADEYAMLSLSDIDGICDFIGTQGIDGVITGFTDSYLDYYYDICKKAGLPCYIDKENLKLTLDKKLFKDTCHTYGLGTIPEFKLDQIRENPNILDGKYPILIKPIDNSGSRGVVKCDSAADLDTCIEYALANSKSKSVLVEEYFDKDDVSVAYVFRNGSSYLSAICDRLIRKTANGGSVTASLLYPSKYTEAFIEKCDAKLKRLFSDLGFNNGVLFLQAFADDNDFYFYEMGYRLSGGRHYISTKNQNDVSALDMLIQFALTGDMGEEILRETPRFKGVCGVLYGACQEGAVIGSIEGLSEIARMDSVLDCSTNLSEGDTVGREGTTAQNVVRIHYAVEKMSDISALIDTFKQKLSVKDTEGKDILYDFVS